MAGAGRDGISNSDAVAAAQGRLNPSKGSNGIPTNFRDYQREHFNLDGFEALSPFEQDQINRTLAGFQQRIDDTRDPEDKWNILRSSAKWDNVLSKKEWKDFLENEGSGRDEFFKGDKYGVEDEMRYIQSLFDDENLEIPVEEEAEEEVVEEEVVEEPVADAPEEEETEEEEKARVLEILTNAPTTVEKDNARVSLNQPTAKQGGTQGYKKDKIANVATSKNSNLNIK
tara:strand:+ start:299 stop:982 length:684 start_codon:yes stop_codon:yes gene_type:complete